MIKTIKFKSEYFNAEDTLTCGQTFRFKPFKEGFLVVSQDKCCYLYTKGDFTYIETEDEKYFYDYFNLDLDYNLINEKILGYKDEFLSKISNLAKGVRILKQDAFETAVSFIISQNNNIKKIQSSIEKLAEKVGKKHYFMGQEYYAFPTAEEINNLTLLDLKSIGLGYRDEYVKEFALKIVNGYDLLALSNLNTPSLTDELLKFKGIGKKVADCITFFGFYRTDSFPVDTWIEKIYIEDFKGKAKNRIEMSKELTNKYKDLSGYVQQYAFYYKRTLEKKKV